MRVSRNGMCNAGETNGKNKERGYVEVKYLWTFRVHES